MRTNSHVLGVRTLKGPAQAAGLSYIISFFFFKLTRDAEWDEVEVGGIGTCELAEISVN
jgi:hypothetical protein